MSEHLITIGTVVVFLGIFLIIVDILFQGKSRKVEGGGIIFMGPFPIIGGATSKQAFYILLAVSAVLMLTFLMLGRK